MEIRAESYATKTMQGWDQFHRFLSGGIPHAEEIAATLAQSSLHYPRGSRRNVEDIDLVHYSSVHHAYRHKKLRCFLTFMELAKNESYWGSVKECRETQFVVIDVFLKDTPESVVEAIRLLPLWLNEQDEESRGGSPSMVSSHRAHANGWTISPYRAA
ncbi:hypothetical protein SH467x_002634 [Pirellulaceae bacterium SH467]